MTSTKIGSLVQNLVHGRRYKKSILPRDLNQGSVVTLKFRPIQAWLDRTFGEIRNTSHLLVQFQALDEMNPWPTTCGAWKTGSIKSGKRAGTDHCLQRYLEGILVHLSGYQNQSLLSGDQLFFQLLCVLDAFLGRRDLSGSEDHVPPPTLSLPVSPKIE